MKKSKLKSLEGLEGWLILIAVVILSRPLFILLQSFPIHLDLLTDISWGERMMPPGEGDSLFWKRLIFSEMISNVVLFIASIYAILLFFSKRKAFTPWYIGIVVGKLIFTFIILEIKKQFIPGTFSYFHTDFVFYRYLFEALVGIPYMLFSKRVYATFIN